jgi:general stress protein 26
VLKSKDSGDFMTSIEKIIEEYLAQKKFITLATASFKGEPSTHPIAHVNLGPVVFFITDSTTRKVVNIRQNQNVAYSVFDEIDHIKDIKFLQMEGTASIIEKGPEFTKAWNMILTKFPFMNELPSNPNNIIVKIIPKKCSFSDYSKGIGHKQTIIY